MRKSQKYLKKVRHLPLKGPNEIKERLAPFSKYAIHFALGISFVLYVDY